MWNINSSMASYFKILWLNRKKRSWVLFLIINLTSIRHDFSLEIENLKSLSSLQLKFDAKSLHLSGLFISSLYWVYGKTYRIFLKGACHTILPFRCWLCHNGGYNCYIRAGVAIVLWYASEASFLFCWLHS